MSRRRRIVSLLVGICLVVGLGGQGVAQEDSLEPLLAGIVKVTTAHQHGSGIVVKINPEEIYILTAAHVVAGDSHPRIQFYQQTSGSVSSVIEPGSELGDEDRGLALLRVKQADAIPASVRALPLATQYVEVASGEPVSVLGLPREVGSWTVLHGYMAARRGRDLTFDVRVDDGASGGALVRKGEVIGLIQGRGNQFGRGNPADSLWVFLRGFGIHPEAISQDKLSAPVKEPVPQPEKPLADIQPGAPEPPTPLPPASLPPQQKINGKDGVPMILIPEGTFVSGSSRYQDNPPRNPSVRAFYMDQYEVTVEQYARFLRDTNEAERIPAGWDDVDPVAHRDRPVAGVNYYDASAYCSWAEKRLPRNNEWEKAARGTDGRLYPWGNQKPEEWMTNFNKNYCFMCNVYDDRIAPVGKFEQDKSPYGVYDMAGNVSEWVEEGVIRGGDWRTGWPGAAENMELARLWSASKMQKDPGGNPTQGFRCAQNPSFY